MDSKRLLSAFAALALLALPAAALAASSNADLSNLAPSVGTLDPVFDSGTLSYTASVPNATTSMTVTPTAADLLATITVNGNAVTSGSPSGSITLSVGANVITTVVTAEDAVTTKTYRLTVTRAPSSNADLSNLVPSAGTLTPAFSSSTYSYTAMVSPSTASMTVTPTAADATATIKVNGNTVASGSASAAISLTLGANVITTVVTAQDGTTIQTYTLTVTRADSPIPVPNPSLERHPSLGLLPDGYDQFHQWGAEAWRQFNRTDNGGPCRIWNPGRPGCGRQGTGSIDEGFNGTAPDGDCIIVVRSSRSDGANSLIDGVNTYYFEALAQVLTNNTPAIFDATKTYTLTAKVGRPPGSFSYTANWYGYAVQLAVGGTLVGGATFAGSCNGGTVIAQDVNTLVVPLNGWVTSTVVYTPNPGDAGLNGQPLQIRLCCLDDSANLANTGIAAFDDVKLEGYVVPAGDVTVKGSVR